MEAIGRDYGAEWVRRHLPAGYFASRCLGRWDLFERLPTEPGMLRGRPIRTGIATRREVVRIARLHAACQALPYRYSDAYWRDLERSRSSWWARFVWFLRFELGI